VNKLYAVIFVISLALLGKMDADSFSLPDYQIVVSFFWATGILRFMNNETALKEVIIDTIKDFVIAVSIIPVWYWMSGETDNELFEPATVILHFIVLMIIVFITSRSAKLSGKVAYYTHAIIPLIAIVLIRLGVPVGGAVAIAVILPEPVNYLFYLKKQKNNGTNEQQK